jgi:hypothetical protein
MKNDKEFSGTLLGFDDYVSTSICHQAPFRRAVQLTCHRHGAGRGDGVVSKIRSIAALGSRADG